MTPIAEFAKQNSISEARAIELIKEGRYSGRIVDGEWFVEDAEPGQPGFDEGLTIKQLFGPFLKGCAAGLLVSLLFGLFTYPWKNPGFEGASGYHLIMMIYATPVLTLGSGIFYWLYKKLIKRFGQ